jgi:large subunit ribosomal protein L35
VPNASTSSFETFCHQLLVNVPLSAAQPTIKGGRSLFNYIPPHPQQGSSAHRYVYVLLEQPQEITMEETSLERPHFDLRRFANTHQLQPVGITFFKAQWTEATSQIYKDVLGMCSIGLLICY